MADTVVLTKTQRQGTDISSSIATVARAGQLVTVYGNLNATVLADPTATLKLAIELSEDDGKTWAGMASAEWHGGHRERNGSWVVPYIGITMERTGLVRAWCDNPVRRQCGLTIRVTP